MISCRRRGDGRAAALCLFPQGLTGALLGGFAALTACLALAVALDRAPTPHAPAPMATAAPADVELPDDLWSAIGPGRAQRISGVFDDFERCCLPAGAQGYETEARAHLSRLATILEISALGRDLLRQARFRGVLLCLDPATDLNGYYRSRLRFVAVRAELSEPLRIAFLAHELGHIPQHPRFSNNRYFPPEDLILMRRMREAAAEAVATRILWQLRQNGYALAWREKLRTRYGDISRAFQAAWAARPGDPDRELKATRAAFDQWFARAWRRNFYDSQTLQHLDRISRDHMGLVPPRRALDHNFLTQIAWVGGENYLLASSGAVLIDERYRSGLSDRNRTRLTEILEGANLPFPADP